jgi:hypothetical protein
MTGARRRGCTGHIWLLQGWSLGQSKCGQNSSHGWPHELGLTSPFASMPSSLHCERGQCLLSCEASLKNACEGPGNTSKGRYLLPRPPFSSAPTCSKQIDLVRAVSQGEPWSCPSLFWDIPLPSPPEVFIVTVVHLFVLLYLFLSSGNHFQKHCPMPYL